MRERDTNKLAYRLKLVAAAIESGAGLTRTAAKIGITPAGLSRYLDAAGYRELRKEMGSATRIATSLTQAQHVERLQAIVEEGSQAAACRKLDVMPAAMSRWLKFNGYGPNFAEDLEDLLDDGSEG